MPWEGNQGVHDSLRSGWAVRGRSATRAPAVSRVRVRVRVRVRGRVGRSLPTAYPAKRAIGCGLDLRLDVARGRVRGKVWGQE